MAVRARVFGVPVEIRLSFFVLVVLLGFPIHPGDPLLLAWVLVATLAILVHEAGHAAVVLAYGGAPRIILLGSGGMTIGPSLGARRHVLMAAAGPVAGLLLGVVLLAAARIMPFGVVPPEVVDDAIWVTFGWSAFNLLPLGGLDGRAVLDALVTVALRRPAPEVGRFVGTLVVVVVVIGTAAAGWFEATFMVAFLAVIIGAPLGALSRLFGAGGSAGGPGLLAVGRADEALAWSEDVLRRKPDVADAWLVRADALRLLTRWDEADAAYTAVLEQRPGLPHALAGRSVARRASGRKDEADADLHAVLGAVRWDRDAVGPAFTALYMDNQFEAAARLLDEELARPDVAAPMRERLTVLRAATDVILGRPEAALPVVEARLATSPDDVTIHELRALALIQLGEATDARRSARRAVAGAPLHPELLETLALTERLCGDAETALPRLVDAATRRPNLPRARAELSACFTQLGRVQEAQAALDGVSGAEEDPNMAYARACLLARAGRPAEAAAVVSEGARIRPALGRIARWDPLVRDAVGGRPLDAGLAVWVGEGAEDPSTAGGLAL